MKVGKILKTIILAASLACICFFAAVGYGYFAVKMKKIDKYEQIMSKILLIRRINCVIIRLTENACGQTHKKDREGEFA